MSSTPISNNQTQLKRPYTDRESVVQNSKLIKPELPLPTRQDIAAPTNQSLAEAITLATKAPVTSLAIQSLANENLAPPSHIATLLATLQNKIGPLGDYHPEIATLYFDLGCAYGLEENYSQAIFYFEQSLESTSHIKGKLPQRVKCKEHLSNLYFQLGLKDRKMENYTSGVLNLTKALEHRTYFLQEHQTIDNSSLPTLETIHLQLGFCHIGKNQNEAALNHLYQAVGYYKKALSALAPHANDNDQEKMRHRKVLMALLSNAHLNIANIHHRNGHYDPAIEHYQAGHELAASALGATSPEVRQCADGLVKVHYFFALSLYCNKQHTDAVSHLKKALEIFPHQTDKEGLQNDHIALGDIHYALGIAQHSLNDYATAIAHLKPALSHMVEAYGTDHATTNNCRLALAKAYLHAGIACSTNGNLTDGIENFRQELHLRTRAKDTNIENCRRNLANTYAELGYTNYAVMELDQALEYYTLELEQRISLNNVERIKTCRMSIAITHCSLGNICFDQTNYKKAIEHYTKEFSFRTLYQEDQKENIKECRKALAQTYCHLASDSLANGDFADSIEYFGKELWIRKSICEANQEEDIIDNARLAYSYLGLGFAYQKRCDFAKAIDCHEHALKLMTKIHGIDNQSIKDTMSHLANDFVGLAAQKMQFKETLTEAFTYYTRALELKAEALGVEHDDVKQCIYYVVNCLNTIIQKPSTDSLTIN